MDIRLPDDVGYRPRAYQRQLWDHFVPSAARKRAVVIAHRRWGKDLLAMNMSGCLSQIDMATYWHVLPFKTQARNIVWNGIDKINKKRFRDYFHKDLIDYTNENEMRVHFKNGSVWQATGADDIDRLVGTNPFGVVLSEWALIDPRVFDYIRPILKENGGWCLMITTIRGKNHAYKSGMKAAERQAQSPNWLYVNQTVNDTFKDDGTRVFSDDDIQEERADGMAEEIIRQEYYNDPDTPLQGCYYMREMLKAREDGRVTSIAYDPKIPVDTYWDIGFSDFTVILFVQEVGQERRIIDVYANSGEEVGHYANELRKRDYSYGRHYGPWDVEIKHLAAGGKSVYDVAKSHGIKFIVTPQPKTVGDGIEQVRNIFPSLWFDGRKCERFIEAISSYRKEPLSEKLQQTGSNEVVYKDTPLHDWTSHYADALRVMAWHARRKRDPNERLQEKAEDNFQYV